MPTRTLVSRRAALCAEEVPLDGSPQTQPCIKLTCDAANCSNAPKGQRTATTVILQLLSLGAGLSPLGAFANMVTLMVTKPQSCKRAFTVRQWFGKDDAGNARRPPAPPRPPRPPPATDAGPGCARACSVGNT